jgi:hypothetical protein
MELRSTPTNDGGGANHSVLVISRYAACGRGIIANGANAACHEANPSRAASRNDAAEIRNECRAMVWYTNAGSWYGRGIVYHGRAIAIGYMAGPYHGRAKSLVLNRPTDSAARS